MQENIGTIYQIVSSIVGIIGGVLIIIYRKNLHEAQKRYLSRRKDYLSQKMLEGMERRSDKNTYILIIVVAVMLIIGATLQLIKIL